mmetsp:Transcript_19079/g.48169  ORF Transcript_19079/g.48169 Transcript_19079/m.48169 type:complete len:302 (-) Transcript_19079:523-1428(-)
MRLIGAEQRRSVVSCACALCRRPLRAAALVGLPRPPDDSVCHFITHCFPIYCRNSTIQKARMWRLGACHDSLGKLAVDGGEGGELPLKSRNVVQECCVKVFVFLLCHTGFPRERGLNEPLCVHSVLILLLSVAQVNHLLLPRLQPDLAVAEPLFHLGQRVRNFCLATLHGVEQSLYNLERRLHCPLRVCLEHHRAQHVHLRCHPLVVLRKSQLAHLGPHSRELLGLRLLCRSLGELRNELLNHRQDRRNLVGLLVILGLERIPLLLASCHGTLKVAILPAGILCSRLGRAVGCLGIAVLGR